MLTVIKRGATDERNYVKKAVNWALRNIGKRNLNLNKAALKAAKEIRRMDSKTARWNASNAIRDLESEAVQRKLRKLVYAFVFLALFYIKLLISAFFSLVSV